MHDRFFYTCIERSILGQYQKDFKNLAVDKLQVNKTQTNLQNAFHVVANQFRTLVKTSILLNLYCKYFTFSAIGLLAFIIFLTIKDPLKRYHSL